MLLVVSWKNSFYSKCLNIWFPHFPDNHTQPTFSLVYNNNKGHYQEKTLYSTFFFSVTNVSFFFLSCLHPFGSINSVWCNTLKVSHKHYLQCFCLLLFLISHGNYLKNSTYPLAVFSRLKQSLPLPPCGSFLSIECLYDSLLCTQKLPAPEDTNKLKDGHFKVMQLEEKRAAWNLKDFLFLLSPLLFYFLFSSFMLQWSFVIRLS